MAQIYPEKWIDGRKKRQAEHQFYNYCRELDPEIIVIHDLEWDGERTEGFSYYQDDFFIIHPRFGILLVEVKGGVRLTYKNRQWKMKPHKGKEFSYSRSPIYQAYDSVRAFVRDIRDQHPDDIPEFIKNSVCYAVCFPDIDTEDINGETRKAFGVNKNAIIDRKRMWNLKQTIEEIFTFWKGKGNLKGVAEWAPGFADTLKSLLVPSYDWQPYLRVAVEHDDTIIERLSDEQSQVWLRSFSTLQFAVPGCAGSGKTLLAIMLAHLWADKGYTTLVCCYNRALADWLKGKIGHLNGVKIYTIHQLWNELLPDEDGYIPNAFPDKLKSKIQSLRISARYEALIIDEAQDFQDDWWLLIDQKKNPDSHLAVFYDDNQQVYPDAGNFPWKLPTNPLTINFRTTRRIHDQINYFYRGAYPPSPAPGAPQGEPVVFRPCGNFTDMVEDCGAILEILKDGGIHYADIVILVPKKDNIDKIIGYLSKFPIHLSDAPDQIYITTVRKFKGLERKIIIITDLDTNSLPHYLSNEILYVAYSRAKIRLYVLYNSELPRHHVIAEEGRRAPINEASILYGLNEQQIQAVQAALGVSVIRAGAGSGKTQVLTRRIAHLIDTYKVDPKSIVAVTFTNKAARELRRRLQDLLSDVAKQITVGTFHSICTQVLRREIPHLPDERWQERDGQFRIVNMQDYFPDTYDSKVYAPWINEQKNEGRTPKDATFSINIPESRHRDYINKFIQYNRILEANNAFDFNDLLSMTISLLREWPNVLDRLQRRWKHILVDEFQDTNQIQFDFVDMMYHLPEDDQRSLTVVGDAQQAIYSWRGAKYQIFRDIDRYYPDAHLYELSVNYRSVPPILDVAHSIAKEELLGVPPLYLDAHRDKENVTLSPIITDTVIEEIDIVADIIIGFVDSGEYQWKDIAILLRVPGSIEGQHTIQVIQNTFTQRNIPYHTLNIESLHNNIFVKVMNASLRVIEDPHEDKIFGDWICTSLFNGIDQATVEILNQERIRLNCKSIWELLLNQSSNSLFPQRTEENLRRNLENLSGIGPVRASRIYEVFDIAQQLLPLQQKLLSGDPAIVEDALILMDSGSGISAKLRNLPVPKKKRKLQGEEEEMDEAPDKGYGALAVWRSIVGQGLVANQNISESIDLLYLSSNDQDAASTEENRVRVQTIHSAKGLEFPIVFVLGFEEGHFPFKKATTVEELREEARICYVALTRARDHLIVSMTKNRMAKLRKIGDNKLINSKNPINKASGEEARPSSFLPAILSIMKIYQDISNQKISVLRVFAISITRSMFESLTDCVAQNSGTDIAVYLEGPDEKNIHKAYSLGTINEDGKQDIFNTAIQLGCNIVEEY